MAQVRDSASLALHGGPQAFPERTGQSQTKIGLDEFMSVAKRFGFAPEALARIRAAISEEDLGPNGPFLGRYYAPEPTETTGPAFEARARELFGVPYALSVSSGTGALHSAMVAVGVGPGTEVICPAIGFYATAATVVEARGIPVFCDVDSSLHMDPAKVEALITPRTVAIAPTHVMGGVCDLDPILEVARKHNLKVVEDCAQSPGAQYKGRWVGTIGDIGCFSISSYKIVGGGEAGLVLTHDQRLWERANQLSECGGLWRPNRFAAPRYEGELFSGTNYRLSELEAAVDIVQLGKLPAVAARYRAVRQQILAQLVRYREIQPQKLNDVQGEVGYLLRFFPQTFELGQEIVRALKAEGIACNTRGPDAGPDWHVYHGMFPITLQSGATADGCPYTCPLYLERGGRAAYARGDCPVADDLFDRVISLPLDQWYNEADCHNVAAGINKVLSAYCTEDLQGASWW